MAVIITKLKKSLDFAPTLRLQVLTSATGGAGGDHQVHFGATWQRSWLPGDRERGRTTGTISAVARGPSADDPRERKRGVCDMLIGCSAQGRAGPAPNPTASGASGDGPS
jgi:hypothetical protein